MIRRFFTTKRLLVLLLVACAAAAGGYAYGFEYLVARGAQITVLNGKVATYTETNEEVNSLQTTLAKTEAGMNQVDGYFIPADGVVDFISSVENLATESGLSVSVDSVGAVDYGKDTAAFEEKLSLRISTEGSWAGTERFLSLVENLPYAVSVDGASIEKVENLQSSPSVEPTNAWKGEFEVSVPKLK